MIVKSNVEFCRLIFLHILACSIVNITLITYISCQRDILYINPVNDVLISFFKDQTVRIIFCTNPDQLDVFQTVRIIIFFTNRDQLE